MKQPSYAVAASLLLLLPAGGCVLAPREAKDEERLLAREGVSRAFDRPFEQRTLPELGDPPTWQDVLRRALLASGELEAAYHEWAMSVAEVPQAGGYPNTPLSVSFEYAFSGEGMNTLDRTTVTAEPDPMRTLTFPTKVYQAAKVATRDAQAAGHRFVAARFDLRRRVLSDWVDYALLAEKIRVQRENLELLKLISDTAVNRVGAGAPQQDLLRAEVAHRLAESALGDLEAEQAGLRARLNAVLARDPDSPLPPPAEIPGPRPLAATDAQLLALAAENNPELAALARRVEGRHDALELARMQYVPDFNPFGGFTGSMEQFVGLAVSLPTMVPQIQGMVREARADLARTEAMQRQAKLDRAASVVATLVALRNSERRAGLSERTVLPAAERVLANSRQAYQNAQGSFLELVESQRTLLEVRLMLAEARAAREKSLAELEALTATDAETLGGADAGGGL